MPPPILGADRCQSRIDEPRGRDGEDRDAHGVDVLRGGAGAPGPSGRADVDDALAEADRLGIAYLPYYPLANGMLTGKYRRGTAAAEGTRLDTWFDERERQEALTTERFDRLEALEGFSSNHGHTLLELAFGWLLAHGPVASVIAGATSAEQVTMNAASGGWILDAADLDAMP